MKSAKGRKWRGGCSYSRGFYRKLCVYVGVELKGVESLVTRDEPSDAGGLPTSIVPRVSLFLYPYTHTHIYIYIYPPTHRPQHPPPSSARTLQIFLFRRKRHLEILLYFLSTFNTLNVIRCILLRSAGLHSGLSPCCDNYYKNITFIYVCCKSSLNFLPKILWMKPWSDCQFEVTFIW